MATYTDTAFDIDAAYRRRAILAATIGNALEWLDFTVYGLFAVTISRLFFPTGDDLSSLLLTVATFGVGFFMRPVGAVVLGSYADRAGRKAALSVTILMMALGTALIGFAPTYATIGLAAPLLIVLARLIQGFSAGGELGGATALLVEYARPEHRGLYASWQQASQAAAVLMGALIGAIVTGTLSPEAMESWGWRVPFLFGLLIGPVGFYIRSHIDEPPAFTALAHERQGSLQGESPLMRTLRDHPREVATGFGVTILWTVCTYVLLFYMPTYTVKQLGMSLSASLVASTIGGAVLFALCPVMGALSDRFGRKPLLMFAAAAIGVLVWPLFRLLNASPDFTTLALVQLVLAVLLAMFTGPAPAVLAELFPTRVRSTGLSVAYNFAVTIFGGFAPFIATWLIAATGSKLAPTFYVMLAAVVSFLTLVPMHDRAGEPLT